MTTEERKRTTQPGKSNQIKSN